MKHVRKFNESDESFRNPDDAIKDFFIDYIDEDPDSLIIKNGWVSGDGEFKDNINYVNKKDIKKYREAKLITLRIEKADGLKVPTAGFNKSVCLTSLGPIKKSISDIERFYGLSDEDINFLIHTEDGYLEVVFIILGKSLKEEDSKSDIMDIYLLELKEILRERGYKRITYGHNNFLDVRTPIKDKNRIYNLNNFLIKVRDGLVNIENSKERNHNDISLIEWRNKVIEGGFAYTLSGGDNQCVVKLKQV